MYILQCTVYSLVLTSASGMPCSLAGMVREPREEEEVCRLACREV